MFLIWTSDHCPNRSLAVCSRWPIAILPASLYYIDDDGVNLTMAAATQEIVASFNHLSMNGIKLREFRSMGSHPVPEIKYIWIKGFDLLSCLVFFFVLSILSD